MPVTPKFNGQPAADAYRRAFRQLWNMPGFDPRVALRAEAGVILKTWAGRTKVVPARDRDFRARVRALRRLGATQGGYPGAVTINAGIKGPVGLVWYQTGDLVAGGGKLKANRRKFQLVGRMSEDGRLVANWYHFTNKAWRDIQDTVVDAEIAIRKELAAAEKSAGLARQSVIQIADELGIDLAKVKGGGTLSASGIAKARAAIASNGRAYRNGSGLQGGDNARCFVELINRLPYGHAIHMDRTLAGVLQGRAKFIAQSYQKGAFDSLRNAARAFPEIFRLNLQSPPAAA